MSDSRGTDGGEVRSVSERSDARIGSIVDKYTIVRLLGRGGMGAVYEARHAKLSRRFAIKFLLPELATKPEILRRFENEAKAAGGLEHVNLAAVTDFGRADDGAPYIVMEFLQGEDCSTLLHRIGPLPIHRAADIVVQASDLVKVLDFGIAKLRAADGSLVTSTGTTFGTAHYMSPEQARGASDVNERTDVWSLGVVLYELLTGRTPFVGDQFLHVIHEILTSEPTALLSLRSDLPPALVTVIRRAMAKDAANRTPSVVALAEAITPFARRDLPGPSRPAAAPVRTLPTPATAVGSAAGTPRASARARNITLVAIGAAVVGIAAFALSRSHAVSSPSQPQQSRTTTTAVVPSLPEAVPVPRGTPPSIEPLPPPVRNPSEMFEHSSDTAAVEPPSHSTKRRSHKAIPTGAPAVAPSAQPAHSGGESATSKPVGRGVTIDPGNPY